MVLLLENGRNKLKFLLNKMTFQEDFMVILPSLEWCSGLFLSSVLNTARMIKCRWNVNLKRSIERHNRSSFSFQLSWRKIFYIIYSLCMYSSQIFQKKKKWVLKRNFLKKYQRLIPKSCKKWFKNLVSECFSSQVWSNNLKVIISLAGKSMKVFEPSHQMKKTILTSK